MEYKYDFFVCYSKTIYSQFVDSFVTELKRYGVDVWLDQKDVHLGNQIIKNLYTVLDSFKATTYGIIVIMDKSFFNKPWCIRELDYIIQNNISFFPILYYIEKQDIPKPYDTLRNYNMVTIRHGVNDINCIVSRVIDIYLQRNQSKKEPIKEEIFFTLIRVYWEADKTDAITILYAENIALYIKVWYKNHNCLMDNYTQVLTNIIHIKLLEYYSFSTISNYDINLVCHAVENLINMFGYSFL